MQQPLQITFRGMDPSEAIEGRIRARVADLERMFGRITSGHITFGTAHKHHRHGNLYSVRVHLHLPDKEVIVGRERDDRQAHEDAYVAIRDAFNAACRQLEDYARQRRRDVKRHEAPNHHHARVVRLFPDDGYGFAELPDATEVYVHEHSVVGSTLRALRPGDEVRLVIADGEGLKGPQASAVVPLASGETARKHATGDALEDCPLCSEELGIDLSAGDDGEYFKWFVASILFGGRINQATARHTYEALVRHDLLTPQKIVAAGREFLEKTIMREGSCGRYDRRKSTQLILSCEKLLRDYQGSPKRVHDDAEDPRNLEARIMAFHGVGPMTAHIFLRELRPYWPKADPEPLPKVRAAAEELGVDLDKYNRKSAAFARLEAGLLREGPARRSCHKVDRGMTDV